MPLVQIQPMPDVPDYSMPEMYPRKTTNNLDALKLVFTALVGSLTVEDGDFHRNKTIEEINEEFFSADKWGWHTPLTHAELLERIATNLEEVARIAEETYSPTTSIDFSNKLVSTQDGTWTSFTDLSDWYAENILNHLGLNVRFYFMLKLDDNKRYRGNTITSKINSFRDTDSTGDFTVACLENGIARVCFKKYENSNTVEVSVKKKY